MLSTLRNTVRRVRSRLPGTDGSLFDAYRAYNRQGLKTLGRLWPNQYAGPIWPRDVPHKRNVGAVAPFMGFGHVYYEEVIQGRMSFLEFAEKYGIVDKAMRNNGLCSFWLGPNPVLYICNTEERENIIRAGHAILSPFQDKAVLDSEALITKPTQDEWYQRDRRQLEINLSQALFRDDALNKVSRTSQQTFATLAERGEMPLFDFTLYMILDVESQIPGVLDMPDRSLAEIAWETPETVEDYKDALVAIVDYLHEGVLYDPDKRERFKNTLMRLYDESVGHNFDAIRTSNERNFFRTWFEKHLGQPFPQDKATFDALLAADPETHVNLAMDMGIVFLVGMFANTVNSFLWTVAEIEENPDVKQKMMAELDALDAETFEDKRQTLRALQYTQNVVLETVRLHPPVVVSGGKVTKGYEVTVQGRRMWIPEGTVLFADLERCNRNDPQYPRPGTFDPDNIQHVRQREGKRDLNTLQFLYTNDTFASFGGGSHKAPDSGGDGANRKCPGRIYSVILQTLLLSNLYRYYDVRMFDVGDDIPDTVITYPIKNAKLAITPRT